MSDSAHDVGLMALLVDGVAHGFPVNSQSFVVLPIFLMPLLYCAVNMHRIDMDQDITDDGEARNDGTVVLVSAAKPSPGFFVKALGPV